MVVLELLAAFVLVVGGASTSPGVQIAGAAALIAAYGLYTTRTVRRGGDADDEEDLKPLWFDTTKDDPPSTLQITAQFAVPLAAIVGGAELFVSGVESIAKSLGVSPLIIALLLAPLATELPEKANSILWMRNGKDVLAAGNITGAMAFQATLPVALGLLLTSWELDRYAVAAAVAGIAGGALALWALPRGGRVGVLPRLVWAGLFAGFVAFAALG